ncbi:MAG TPA: ABC transporter permease [Bryobacteraceae bacterium]|nr:ABC transporter permease [Bryobacteraceae bacterium]
MIREVIPRRLLSNLLGLIVIVLLGGFAAAALVRYSPGFSSIPEDLDPSISPETLQALHAKYEDNNPLPVFYARYLAGTLKGGFGISTSLNQPVAELLRRRAPVTAKLIATGTAGGLLLGALLAWMAVWTRKVYLQTAAFSISGLLLAVPPAVLALAFFFNEAPLSIALALALFPRLFGTMRTLLDDASKSPALLAARARGISPGIVAGRYVLGGAVPQLVALVGVALMLAFGSAIPIEVICGVPGIGALALQAAIGRDMPLLCALALIITFFVTLVHSVGDLLA